METHRFSFINKDCDVFAEIKSAKKLIIHPGVFHLDDVFLSIFITEVNPHIEVLRKRDISPEELNDSQIIVADIGSDYNPSKNNFDHHQGMAGEMALSLFLKKFWEVFFINEFAFRLYQKKFLDFSSKYDNGDINPADYSHIPVLQRYVNLFNFSVEGDTSNNVSFKKAVSYFKDLVILEINSINELASKYDEFKSYKIPNTQIAFGKYLQGWQEIAPEFRVRIFIMYDPNRLQYNIQSWNTNDVKFDENLKEVLEMKLECQNIFLHKAGFLIAIPEKCFIKEVVIPILDLYLSATTSLKS